MNKILAIALLTCSLASAQTIAPTVGATNVSGNFFSTAFNWFGTDTGYRWNTNRGYFQAGAAYQNQVNVAAQLEVGYNISGVSNNTGFTLSADALNAGIAGTIVSSEVNAFYRIDIKDVQFLAGPGVGCQFHDPQGGSGGVFGAIVGELQKKVGAPSHLFVRLEEDVGGKKISKIPLVLGGAGGSF